MLPIDGHRLRRAVHEAGHVALDLVCGAGVATANIREDDEGNEGVTTRVNSDLLGEAAYCFMAGRAAEEVAGVEIGDVMDGHGTVGDLRNLAALFELNGAMACRTEDGCYTEEFAQAARAIVSIARDVIQHEEIAALCQGVTEELYATGELSRRTLDALNDAYPVGASRLTDYRLD